MTELPELCQAIVGRKATLVLGQNHSPDLVSQILRAVTAITAGAHSATEIPKVFVHQEEAGVSYETATKLLTDADPDIALIELMSLPWTSIVTSAVDNVFMSGIRSAGSMRRVVELGPEQTSVVANVHSAGTVHVIRCFGSVGGGAHLDIPRSAQALMYARALKWPSVLSQLHRFVGLGGVVVVAGFTENDWVDEQGIIALASTLQLLPPGRCFWFGWSPVLVRTHFAGHIQFEEQPFTMLLRSWAVDNDTARSLQIARESVFGQDERLVTVRAGASSTCLRFTAREWRSIGQVVDVVDDHTLAKLHLQNPSERKGVRSYLRESHAGVPNWMGPAAGYIFERRSVSELIETVVRFLAGRKESIHSARGRPEPFLLCGPPATGKTLGLLLASWRLRSKFGLCVMWLLRGAAGADFKAVEQVVRLFEEKGAGWTVLVADDPEPTACARLQAFLASAGRRAIIIGSESTREEFSVSPDGRRRFPLHYTMTSEEAVNLTVYFKLHGIAAATDIKSNNFLQALTQAIPEVRFGAIIPLLDEYERVLRTARIDSPANNTQDTVMSLALQKAFPALANVGPIIAPARFDAEPILRRLLLMVLFCSQIEHALPHDVALHLLGSPLLSKFPHFISAFESTALIHEIELDHEGNTALATSHQVHAELLLSAVSNDRVNQLDILEDMANCLAWRSETLPGEFTAQDFVISVFRTVGPRGAFTSMFNSRRARIRLAEILSRLIERKNVRLPSLLTLEAMLAGDLGKEATARSDAEMWCQRAQARIQTAVDILRARSPSAARNFELQRALTLAADIRGTRVNAILRTNQKPGAEDTAQVLDLLEEVTRDVMLARSFNEQYHPLDVMIWAHRDAFDRLQSQEIKLRMLSKMAGAIEVAQEEVLETAQAPILRRRRIELAERGGQVAISEALAETMRREGDFSGELTLSRSRLAATTRVSAELVCKTEFDRLMKFEPAILRDAFSIRFLHNLWCRRFSVSKLGEGHPLRVMASIPDWRHLALVTKMRLAIPEDGEHPFTLFCRGWALYQIGESRDARETFRLLDRLSYGMARRIGQLVLLTTEGGTPAAFDAQVVRVHGDKVTVQIRPLDDVLDLRPEVAAAIALEGMQVGELVKVNVALNYRGPQIVAVKEDR